MRWTRILNAATCLLIGLLLCVLAFNSLHITQRAPQPSDPLALHAVHELTELVVLEAQAADLVRAEVGGYTGWTSVQLRVHGTVTLGVELKRARLLKVYPGRRHIVLSLPPPSVRSVAIDPRRTIVLGSERGGLWRLVIGEACEGRAIAQALATGQSRLKANVLQDDHALRAKRHTEVVLHRYAAELGWTVDLRWDQ